MDHDFTPILFVFFCEQTEQKICFERYRKSVSKHIKERRSYLGKMTKRLREFMKMIIPAMKNKTLRAVELKSTNKDSMVISIVRHVIILYETFPN